MSECSSLADMEPRQELEAGVDIPTAVGRGHEHQSYGADGSTLFFVGQRAPEGSSREKRRPRRPASECERPSARTRASAWTPGFGQSRAEIMAKLHPWTRSTPRESETRRPRRSSDTCKEDVWKTTRKPCSIGRFSQRTFHSMSLFLWLSLALYFSLLYGARLEIRYLCGSA